MRRSSAASFFSQLCNWVAQLLIFRQVRFLFAIIRPPDLKSRGNLCPAPTQTDFSLPRVGPGPSLEILGLGLFLLLAGEETLEVLGPFVYSETARATQHTFFLRLDLPVMTESFRCHNFVSVASR